MGEREGVVGCDKGCTSTEKKKRITTLKSLLSLSSNALSILRHSALIIRQPSYTASKVVGLYGDLTVWGHYATCTLCHVNSHYYMEKHGVITELQTAMLSCAMPNL